MAAGKFYAHFHFQTITDKFWHQIQLSALPIWTDKIGQIGPFLILICYCYILWNEFEFCLSSNDDGSAFINTYCNTNRKEKVIIVIFL